MKKKQKTSPVSVRDVAIAAGVSKSAASYALQNQPGVSKVTRDRVLRVAERLGYVRDARLSSWMTQVRETKAKDLLPLALLNTDPIRDAFLEYKFMSPYLEGARKRCLELGYRIEVIWTREPGLTLRRLSRILYHRGIEGVIICHPARHVRLDFEHFAGVSIEGALLAPRLHRVMSNIHFNLNLAIKSLKRLGYRRIGVCLADQIDSFSDHLIRALLHYGLTAVPPSKPVAPLFHPNALSAGEKAPYVKAWLKKEKPDVIICNDNNMLIWLERFGYDVPGDIGVVHLGLDDDVLEWAGIYSNRRVIGSTAAELLISLVQNRQFGIPESSSDTLIRGTWRHGRTLRPIK